MLQHWRSAAAGPWARDDGTGGGASRRALLIVDVGIDKGKTVLRATHACFARRGGEVIWLRVVRCSTDHIAVHTQTFESFVPTSLTLHGLVLRSVK